MTLGKKKTVASVLRYIVLILVGFLMVYPLLWMVSATFKDNSEIFTNMGLIPRTFSLNGYINAFNDYGGNINIWRAMLNTYSYVIPKVFLRSYQQRLQLMASAVLISWGRNSCLRY